MASQTEEVPWWMVLVPKTERMPMCRRLAEVLRQKRREMKLSQEEVAKRAGVSRQMIGQMEAAAQVPTVDVLARVCVAFREPPSRLFGAVEGSGR